MLSHSGIEIEGVSFEADTEFLLQGEIVNFFVGWEKGTDVLFTIHFNDSDVYDWNFLTAGHTSHYMNMSAETSHEYTLLKNITATLVISNAVGQLSRDVLVHVEPNVSTVIDIDLLYIPRHVPTPVAFSFGLSTVISEYYIILWCDFVFGDPDDNHGQTFMELSDAYIYFNHTYISEQPNASASILCFNHVSNTTWEHDIILQEKIMSLEITPNASSGVTFEDSKFNLSMATGSDTEFHVDYGDGSLVDYTHSNVYSSEEDFVVTHVYMEDITFSINVYAYNLYFNSSTVLNYVVQNRVHKLALLGPGYIDFPPGIGDFLIFFTEVIPNPTNVSCNWTVNEVVLDSLYTTELSSGQNYTRSMTYTRQQLGANMTLAVICYNLASHIQLDSIYSMYEVIANASVNIVPAQIGTNITGVLIIAMTNGSEVYFDIDFGDGEIVSEKHYNRLAFEEPFVMNKTYTEEGNYSVSAFLRNFVSSLTINMSSEVIIQNAIVELNLQATDFTVWPPGTLNFVITPTSGQAPLRIVHCEWDFGGVSDMYTFIEVLTNDQPHAIEINTTRAHLGYLNTSVYCYNVVSNITLTAMSEVELDAIILSDLQNNGTIFWTNTTGFVLNIARFGTRACFHWDMGNGKPGFIYGMPLCEEYADENALIFEEVPFGQMTLLHNYTYPDFGHYTVTVFAFNHVSNDTLYTDPVVLDWLCFAPNITLPNETLDSAQPYQHGRCLGYMLDAEIDILCWKTHNVLKVWEVFDRNAADNDPPVLTSADATRFDITIRLLAYGAYDFRITTSMDGVEDTTKVEHSYIDVVKCPLIVSIVGGEFTQVKMGTTYEINATDVSFDPDVEPWDKSGMQFLWSCERTDTTNFEEVLGDQITIFDGCFNDGYDLAAQTEGKFILDADRLLPMSWHTFRLELVKDTRRVVYEKEIYIAPQDPPIIEIG